MCWSRIAALITFVGALRFGVWRLIFFSFSFSIFEFEIECFEVCLWRLAFGVRSVVPFPLFAWCFGFGASGFGFWVSGLGGLVSRGANRIVADHVRGLHLIQVSGLGFRIWCLG